MASIHKLKSATLVLPVSHIPFNSTGKGTILHRLALNMFPSQHSSMT